MPAGVDGAGLCFYPDRREKDGAGTVGDLSGAARGKGAKDKIAECYIRMNELKKGAGSALDGKSQVRSREEKGL